jgi:hypothetical protein
LSFPEFFLGVLGPFDLLETVTEALSTFLDRVDDLFGFPFAGGPLRLFDFFELLLVLRPSPDSASPLSCHWTPMISRL